MRSTASRASRRYSSWNNRNISSKTVLNIVSFRQSHRTHAGMEGRLPEPTVDGSVTPIAFDSYQWRSYCRGLYQTPIAA